MANVLLLFAVQPEMIVQVCAVISSMGVAIAYIIGEAKVDAARVAKPTLK
ncbi:MAG: hypothetical protein PHX43_05405 [Alphaproteobacteria bacterium]|nr:hypothetical protein [Alphaproteobacteria bacterium]